MIINITRNTDKQDTINRYLSWKKDKDFYENKSYTELLKNDLVKKTEDFIVKAHKGQVNKVDKKPFHNHPIGVAKIITSFIPEDIAVIQAGLAHDVIEDCEDGYNQVLNNLGEEVLELVKGVTEIDKSYSWQERKDAYLEHLSIVDTRTLIVSLADHMHNIHRLMGEYIELGESLWENFGAKKDIKIKYFYRYADKITSVLRNHKNNNHSSIFAGMYSDYIILLDYFGNITQTDIDTNINYDLNLFTEYYNTIADSNGGHHYEENENSKYLIYDFILTGNTDVKIFAESKYKLEQEY